ncbi:SDR family oxidoreductase [Falsibacillus pallidus]|uniref:Thioester reductase-like protein n=1 Tax=Falsibacillus pallidus TaxID=493781 RepID=A0A370GVK1_9BACI|nr:SDR family oxidoreductase [Falsibacillus pallidus]RDI47702.1 thioester reductase-like protein [Falsibacillus pallidus]
MGENYFITGFPGFLSGKLIEGILEQNPDAIIYLLYVPSMKQKAESEIARITEKTSIHKDQLNLVPGDITKNKIGVEDSDWDHLVERIDYIWHLAAIYDLAVPRDIAQKVNVEGTQNVNEFVKNCTRLKRYVYFSTAYVAGDRTGILKEDELIRPKGFHNYYEETKFEAEILVEQLKGEVPVTIIRPGIVKGDSKTGETVKFDGPYFIMNMLHRLRYLPFLPAIKGSDAEVNLVPVDYVIKAVMYLGHHPIGENKTYHITDPSPYKVSTIYAEMMNQLVGKKPLGAISKDVIAYFLSKPTLRRMLGVEKEALDYFIWDGHFDCSQTKMDLEGTGIKCPDFLDGLPSMVQFYKKNKDNQNYHIKIQ